MSNQNTFPDPSWVKELPEAEQAGLRARFLIKLAALYYDPRASIEKLNGACGLAGSYLTMASKITPEVAVLLERQLGREHFPRELFRPDLFVIQE